MRSLWRRLETSLEHHLAHRRRRHCNTQTLKLADDPFVDPMRVLPSETKDQLAERALKRRSPGPPVLVCPRRAISWRCQRSSVSGLNEKAAQAV
jgi:hypothetical protein